ncbi:MAG: hypothetical protein ACR2K1_05005 [Saprospiraceae bacterium]
MSPYKVQKVGACGWKQARNSNKGKKNTQKNTGIPACFIQNTKLSLHPLLKNMFVADKNRVLGFKKHTNVDVKRK